MSILMNRVEWQGVVCYTGTVVCGLDQCCGWLDVFSKGDNICVLMKKRINKWVMSPVLLFNNTNFSNKYSCFHPTYHAYVFKPVGSRLCVCVSVSVCVFSHCNSKSSRYQPYHIPYRVTHYLEICSSRQPSLSFFNSSQLKISGYWQNIDWFFCYT